jgi:hypothetical protein
LFVFDGLDEVPGDVKDLVANEIVHFVDDVLVGCRADAATVCTSRPQGYSGQFAALEAATIELVNLSRDQALACATPLLSLDRSESERKTYVDILRTALQSQAIAEIMTTPLQAHIMAVIVRDGGKPPERKWQLFDTFYKVIQKREANRNLPDPKLAALLREGDKLLKAIHNRLGFELHSRAETKKGAVTSLERCELNTIMTEVVSQFQDANVEDTVTTLMEATTQRLVLVSTPEAGNYVRFDIRPLQEFFAAEHLYESGEPDRFVERMRVIAADSHWREVVHFLLSALVEQNRKSELAAAVTVLSQTDDGGDGGIRALNRRLAHGGIITARLLQEGVLEQDKRVREQFRSCIIPLLGCIDAGQYLAEVRSPHSDRWLCDVLIANLKEQAEPETVGTMACLFHILPDSDLRLVDVISFITEASPEYRRVVITKTPGDLAKVPVRTWIVEMAIRALLRSDWWTLGAQGISALRVFLGAVSNDLVCNIAIRCGVPAELSELTMPVFCARGDPPNNQRPRFMENRYGVIDHEYIKSSDIVDFSAWFSQRSSALQPLTGILQTAQCVFAFVQSPREAGAAAVLASVGGDVAGLRCLPECVQAYLARDFPFGAPAHIEAQRLFKRETREYTMRRGINIVPEKLDLKSLIQDEPWIVIYLLRHQTEDADFRITGSELIVRGVSEPRIQRLLIKRLETGVQLAQFAWDWGSLFALPGELGESIREAALSSADAPVGSNRMTERIKPFRLKLPREANLLPHLVGALARGERAFLSGEVKIGLRPPAECSQLVGAYSANPSAFADVAKDGRVCKRARAAGMVLSYLHPETMKAKRLPAAEEIIEHYERANSGWYLPAIAVLFSDAVAADNVEALDTIGRVIEAATGDYNGRSAMESAIKGWRELARAPVQRLACPKLWI